MKQRYSFIALIMLIAVFSCKKSTVDINDGFPVGGKDSSKVTVDTSLTKVDVSKFSEARVFPGLVCAEEPRITTTLNMNLSYTLSAGALRISVPPYPQFSTGLYAAPGELITVDIPEGIYSLAVQIGAWTDNLSGKQASGTPIQRAPLIYMKQQLAPGRNYVRNLYGGHVYILSNTSQSAPVSITFGNVCKSPDYVLGETDATKWKADILKSCVPHLEFRSKNFAFVVPKEYCIARPIADPEAMLKEWDLAMDEDVYKWTGLVENAADPIDQKPMLPIRFILDVDLSAGYGHAGFPIVAKQDFYWFTAFTNVDRLRNADVWGTYHEIGHNMQQSWWSWSSLGETSNNLFIYKLAKRMFDRGYTAAWPPRENYTAAMAATAITFAADAAAKDFDGTDTRINNPFYRLTPFLQIFEKVPANWDGNGMPDGWGFFPYLYSQSRRGVREPGSDLAKHDFFYEKLSDYTKKNWILFFKRWGIQISDVMLNNVIGKGYPLMLQDMWNYNPITKSGGNVISTYDPYSKVYWSIQSVSTQQTSGEGAGNGVATAIIDGNNASYWHSNYTTLQPFPYTIIIDFNNLTRVDRTIDMKGFVLTQRQNATNRHIKNLIIEYSNDLKGWTPATGSPYLLVQSNAAQTFNLPATISARYIRLTVAARADLYATDGPHACLAEFNVVKP